MIWHRIDETPPPMDGTCIIAWDGEFVWPIAFIDEPDDLDQTGWCDADFFCGGFMYHANNITRRSPTHWMPLPTPPEDGE